MMSFSFRGGRNPSSRGEHSRRRYSIGDPLEANPPREGGGRGDGGRGGYSGNRSQDRGGRGRGRGRY